MVSDTESIYGEDNRVDPHKHDNENLKRLSESIVLLTTDPNTPNTTGGYCSGGLFSFDGRNFLLTAGHCIETQEKCENTFLVLNYENHPSIENEDQVVFKCSKLLFTKGYPDFAIATFSDTPIFGKLTENRRAITPIEEIGFSKNLLNTKVAVVGHPEGGRKKIADDCSVIKVFEVDYSHQCDTFSGNSGSPMFDLTDNSLSGVLVSGRGDKIGNKDRRYKLGNEFSTDIANFQNQVLAIVRDGKPNGEIFISRDQNTYIPFTRDARIFCDSGISAAKCKQKSVEIIDVIDKAFSNELLLDELTVFLKPSSSETSSNRNTYLSIAVSEHKNVFQQKISEWLDIRKKLRNIEQQNRSVAGIKIKCNEDLDVDLCSKTIANIRNVLNDYKEYNRTTLDIYIIYIEPEWEIRKNWINVRVGSAQNEIIANFKQRIEFIESGERDFTRVADLTVKQGFNVNKEQFLIGLQKVKNVFSRNSRYNMTSLDAHSIYIKQMTVVDKAEYIEFDFRITESDIERLLNERFVEQE